MKNKERSKQLRGAMAALAILCCPIVFAAEKRALLIGINDYLANDAGAVPADGDTWVPEDLNGALNDIALMRRVLESRYGFEPSNIRTLENAAATREALLTTLEEFVASTGPEDIVYIHFSGHGSQVPDQDGDEEDALDETILPHDARTGSIPDITDDELGRALAALATPNALVVLDSCHSGTATRGSSSLKARSVPADRRGDIYADLPNAERGDSAAEYVLMTGAADYQSALDGPIDEGRYYGLFTLSLGRALSRMPSGATIQALHREARQEMERIGEQFGLFALPDAQLEAASDRLSRGILGDAAVSLARRDAARLAWAEAAPRADGGVTLRRGAAMAAAAGSIWAIYPPEEAQFKPGAARAIAIVERLENGDAIARLPSGTNIEAGSRAVPQAPAPPDSRVAVRLDRVSGEDREALGSALRATPGGQEIDLVFEGGFARYIVDREGAFYRVFGADGVQAVATLPAADPANAARELVKVAARSRSVNDVLSLDNPASAMQVDVRVNPVDAAGNIRGVAVVGAADVSAFRVRRPGEPRSASNSLQLEISVSQDSYLTVVDVDPEGAVAVLFPNPVSERNGFLPGGFVRAGTTSRIPDALEGNRAGFYWDYVPPAGVDTLRVFAASDLETARRIRSYLAGFAGRMNQRGAGGAGPDRMALYSPSGGMTTRGVAVVEEDSLAGFDWTAASVTVVIEE